MADHRSPEEIEREIERERAELSSTLDTLTSRFSIDGMTRTASDYVSEHGGELSTNFLRSVKETPTAAVLTAIGIGWMIVGNQRQKVVEYRDRPSSTGDGTGYRTGSYERSDYDTTDYDTSTSSTGAASAYSSGASSASYDATSSADYGSSTGGSDDGRSFEERVAAADARMRASSTGTSGYKADDRYRSPSYDDDRYRYASYDAERDMVSRDYGGGRSEDETSMLERISDHAQDLWHQTVASLRGGYRSASRSAQSGYQSAYRSATELRNSLFEGTEKMDVAGRERVASARARAYQAQLRARGYASRGQERAGELFYEQPLVAGAMAMALGAVVGGLLPRTRREDEAFGAYRDQLFADAESVFQDERQRAEAAARAAISEAGNIAQEAKNSVLDRTPDGREAVREAEGQARTAAQRIADAARDAHDHPEKSGTSTSSGSSSGSTTVGATTTRTTGGSTT